MDKIQIVTAFAEMAFEDLAEIKEALTAIIKSRKEEAKIAQKEAKELAKAESVALATDIQVGDMVTFTYKGGLRTGTVIKKTEKTLHFNRGEAGLDGDEAKNAYIAFRNVVSFEHVETEAQAEAVA